MAENGFLEKGLFAGKTSNIFGGDAGIIMPNHLHFFARPGRLHADVDNWVQYWKSIFTKRLRKPDCRWQRASFHHRIRSDESAEERRAYMIENPVRAGLVQRACGWPYRGEVFKPGFWW